MCEREWVMSHVWMSHVPRMNESCPIYEGVMSPTYVRLEGIWWLLSGVWVWERELVSSHAWMSHVPCMNEPCPMYEWVMYSIWMSHVLCMNVSCPIYEWVMSHTWMRDGSRENSANAKWCVCDRENESCRMYEWVMSYIWVRRIVCMNESCPPFINASRLTYH